MEDKINKIFNIIKEFFSLIKYVIFTTAELIIDNILIKTIDTISPIVIKITEIIIRNIIISFVLSIIITFPIYYLSPEIIKWVFMKMSFSDFESLELLNKLNKKQEIIDILEKELEEFRIEKNNLESEKSKALAEKEGILKIMNDFKIDKANYVNIIIGIGVIIGLRYWLFFYNDGEIFKIINESITSINKEVILNNEKNTLHIEKVLTRSIESIDAKLSIIQNSVDIINARLKELQK